MGKTIDRNKQIAAFIHSVTDSGIESEAQGIILSSGGSGPNYITNAAGTCAQNTGECDNASSCSLTENRVCTNWVGACIGSGNGFSCKVPPSFNSTKDCLSVNVTPSSCKKG